VEHDSFSIQKELKRVGVFTVVALIIWQIETALLSPDAANYYVVSDFDNSFIVFVDLIWVTFLPLKATYNQLHSPMTPLGSSHKPLSPSRGSSARSYDSSSLEAVLANPVGYQDFFGFLAKEWSTENLLFWKQVNEYKVIVNQEQRTKKAQAIYETFVRENAIYEVNLPDTIRKELRSGIEQTLGQGEGAPFELFDAAQNEIFSLMSNDSFSRFLKMEESFIELSNINDVSIHDNSSATNSRKEEGSSAASTRVEVTIGSKDSPAHTSIQVSSDELEPLEKNVREEEPVPDENQHVFVL